MLGILAHHAKTEPGCKKINGRLTYTNPGIADRIGTFEGGRSFAAEAKSTSEGILYRSEVKPKQQEHLNAVAKAGGLALLLIEFRMDMSPYWVRFAVPWLDTPWEIKRSAESVSPLMLVNWSVSR